MPGWGALGLAMLVVLATCARGWAAPPSTACDGRPAVPRYGVDADEDAPLDGDDADEGDEIVEADPALPPASELHEVAVPAVRRVVEAAYRAAGLDGHPATSWRRRSRVAGLVPWLSVRTGRNTSWVDDQTSAVDHGMTLEARATWRLDRLVFDPHELQVASIDAARRRERRRLANRVIRAYYTFLRTASAARVHPRWRSHADEAAAELDALTDTWFSDELTRLRRAASEHRTL